VADIKMRVVIRRLIKLPAALQLALRTNKKKEEERNCDSFL
jgi:hypothetical protein